jgi:hypothetical protein
MKELAERLLDAHVQHELSHWRPPQLEPLVKDRVAALFRWLASLRVDQLASRAQVMAIIERYVFEARPSGALTELAGEMAQIVFTCEASAQTRLNEVLDDQSYAQFASKLSALDRVRQELVALIAHSQTVHEIRVDVLSRSLVEAVLGSASNEPTLPELGPVVAWARRLRPWLERRLGAALARHLPQPLEPSAANVVAALDAEQFHSVLDDVWAAVSAMRLSEAFAWIGEQDLEDFVVLGYEFWTRYRKSPYFRRITEQQVDHFFDKFGAGSARALLEDLGVTESVVVMESVGVLQPLLRNDGAGDALEALIRARLQPFYCSQAFDALLAAGNPQRRPT